MNRREMLAAAAVLPGAMAEGARAAVEAPRPGLPAKAEFPLGTACYLDAGSMHPIGCGAREALERYQRYRGFGSDAPPRKGFDEDEVRAKFARLINADADEIAFVQSTTAGENLILQALGLPAKGAHVVTDTLHFFGSLPIYAELEKAGVEVTWIAPRDGRIALDDIERAVRKGTRLVALSQVSTINGFEHDLRRVCEIAHAQGALVYADIVHAAGCIPVDVHASGVDFAACASYKWLMGDFGLGFLYVRKDRQAMLRPPSMGYHQIRSFTPHYLPFDPPGPGVVEYTRFDGAIGLFGQGTFSFGVAAMLNHSLDYLQAIGVPAIQAHAQTLTDRLKQELPRRGYPVFTPQEARTPMVAGLLPNARQALGPVLSEAKVRITLSANRFRVSVSVFNDQDDIDRLLAALPRR
ncbi:aminotransferase class V-fold PLP-dependent enzyme [Mitsuaria sp. GD03876]|uniref:aminotransferase class V-fold PLP-dependent enzyme n=1 Tax=Mitsuaria sp. GD03876 TaxID=2975399 RepID=UPI002447A170|nr:aminotransferase class V-fold PLP-dependent enzyme [Mitsuaria sp. GD03876]MDH0867350.1 aminotransferase class V-fold PLP-dependent enzyme [Mitsuaria sp. GD03876]